MEMPSPPKCPQCGAEVKTVALGGLCPACVARMGFGGDDLDGEASTVTEAQGVASADEPPAPIKITAREGVHFLQATNQVVFKGECLGRGAAALVCPRKMDGPILETIP